MSVSVIKQYEYGVIDGGVFFSAPFLQGGVGKYDDIEFSWVALLCFAFNGVEGYWFISFAIACLDCTINGDKMAISRLNLSGGNVVAN